MVTETVSGVPCLGSELLVGFVNHLITEMKVQWFKVRSKTDCTPLK